MFPSLPVSSLSAKMTTEVFLGALQSKSCHKRSVGANPVVMTVSADHAPVKAQVFGFKCRHQHQLRGKKIAFHHAVFLVQDAMRIFSFDLLAGLVVLKGTAADEDIQLLPLDTLRQRSVCSVRWPGGAEDR